MGKFVSQVARPEEGKRYGGAGSSNYIDPGKIAAKILPGLKGGQLFAYCFRRFGYPTWGWDGYKNLVTYTITTPQPDLFLSITPYMADDIEGRTSDPITVEIMFGYRIEVEQERALYHLDSRGCEKEIKTRTHQIHKALSQSIRDLLRPTNIRDCLINCYGRVADTVSGLPSQTGYYAAAGYPIIGEFYDDTDRWLAFVKALYILGENDFGKGIQKVVDLAKEKESTSTYD